MKNLGKSLSTFLFGFLLIIGVLAVFSSGSQKAFASTSNSFLKLADFSITIVANTDEEYDVLSALDAEKTLQLEYLDGPGNHIKEDLNLILDSVEFKKTARTVVFRIKKRYLYPYTETSNIPEGKYRLNITGIDRNFEYLEDNEENNSFTTPKNKNGIFVFNPAADTKSVEFDVTFKTGYGNSGILIKMFPEIYQVSFDSNDGSAIETQKVNKGEKAAKPADPTKENHTFDGWYKDANLSEEFDFESSITENVTLFAKWTKNEAEKPTEDQNEEIYQVSFDSNDGSAIETQKVNKGEKAAKPADPTKENHTFDGWYKDANLSEEFDFESSITENVTLFAKWTKNEAEKPTEDQNEEKDNSENKENENSDESHDSKLKSEATADIDALIHSIETSERNPIDLSHASEFYYSQDSVLQNENSSKQSKLKTGKANSSASLPKTGDIPFAKAAYTAILLALVSFLTSLKFMREIQR
ncbi:MAG: InlB B-repeat-containing protein [Coriobacteriia bacterium]|nr:InlB B-repeat-containing protein [Coriobacteriia bacterium]